MIEFAQIMSNSGESSSVETVSARMFAIGTILYELFSTEKPPMDYLPTSNARFVTDIDLTDETESNNERPQKKAQKHATQTGDQVSNFL